MSAIIFDTETTGLVQNRLRPLHHQPRVIEFCGFTEENGETINIYETLIQPQSRLADVIVRVTGITDRDLIDAPIFADVAEKIRGVIEGADIVVAHNLTFDMAMVDMEFARLGEGPIRWPRTKICTVEASEHYMGFRLSLTALHEYLFDCEFEKAHRARGDVLALTKCYVEMKKRGDVL